MSVWIWRNEATMENHDTSNSIVCHASCASINSILFLFSSLLSVITFTEWTIMCSTRHNLINQMICHFLFYSTLFFTVSRTAARQIVKYKTVYEILIMFNVLRDYCRCTWQILICQIELVGRNRKKSIFFPFLRSVRLTSDELKFPLIKIITVINLIIALCFFHFSGALHDQGHMEIV